MGSTDAFDNRVVVRRTFGRRRKLGVDNLVSEMRGQRTRRHSRAVYSAFDAVRTRDGLSTLPAPPRIETSWGRFFD
jgi:hypothetical protein